MFDETLVVQSAISAFNNAALIAPTFFWVGVLALPLMALVYFYGCDFMERIGWHKSELKHNASILTVAVTLLWLISFGGNYAVLRDGRSILPFCIAGIVFLCCMLLGAVSRNVSLPWWRGASFGRRLAVVLCMLAAIYFVGRSGMHTWWGAAMQIAAFVGGLVFGRAIPRVERPSAICFLVILGVVTLVLMQPEFFRFGQLGALGALHLLALGGVGAALAADVAICCIRPSGRIHNSAYIKLKWMMRFIVMLAIVLFLLTESVPVFLGMIAAIFVMFAMAVWHAASVPENLNVRFRAIALFVFGMVTTLPVISALGVMLWASAGASKSGLWAESQFLL